MIFTLNARNNVMLQVLKEYLQLTDQQCYKIINNLFSDMNVILQSKGIDYIKLKSALIPVHKDHFEIAFIFDTLKINSAWYGYTIFSSLIPALNKEGTYSIFIGDIIAESFSQELIKKLLFKNIKKYNDTIYMHCNQYFVVYINYLTKNQLNNILNTLINKDYFIGYIDMTFGSILKNIFSSCLVPHAIKHKNVILQPHEIDRNDDDNINISGYPYEENGFIVKSINQSYFDLFLSYKIESLYADNDDLSFSFNALYPLYQSTLILPLNISERKCGYLKKEKTNIFETLGLIDYTIDELKKIIISKISQSYIYNLGYTNIDNKPKFNVSLELKTKKGNLRKVLVSLKYIPESNHLELITMY